MLWGVPLAVCARCTGIYTGFLAGAVLYAFLVPVGRDRVPHIRMLGFAAAPMAAEFILSHLGLWTSSNTVRAFTGAALGFCLAFFLIPGVVNASNPRKERRK